MELKGKHVLITGASSGIGEAIAKEFAAKGAVLLLAGRNVAELERVKKACAGARAVDIVRLDLSQHDVLFDIAEQVLDKHGYIDVLINNAGVSQRAYARDLPFESDKFIINVDLLGTIALTKAFLPSMLARRSGHIVTISSLMGKFGTPLRSSYAAAKHGLHGFFDSLRAEIYQDNIEVLMVCPGFIRTNVSVNAIGPDGNKQGTMDEATGKGLEPKVVAQKIIEALGTDKEEIFIGGKEMIGVYLKRFAPALFSRLVRKMKVT